MADLYLTPAEKYTAALGGFYYGDLPEPGTVYTQLIKDILDGSTPDKEPKNILARFIYSLYISDLGDPYPRYELAKLLYWKLHDITPTKVGSVLTVTIDGEEDYMTINTDLSRLWYKVLFGSKTDVITEFPYIFNTMQNKLSDWELFGNTETSGTQTPDNPVMPQGTGERTINLAWTGWAQDFVTRISNATNAIIVNDEGRTALRVGVGAGYGDYDNKYIFKTDFKPNTQYAFSFYGKRPSTQSLYSVMCIEYIDNTVTSFTPENDGNYNYYTIISEPNKTIKYLRAQYTSGNLYIDIDTFMVNEGSTALPYEPFGVKIPISSANTTTPVYLGEVPTTRKVKKLVLTGEETFVATTSATHYRCRTTLVPKGIAQSSDSIVSTHYFPSSGARDGAITLTSDGGSVYFTDDTKAITAESFKSYLAAQYAAGTPVTVWYVLATEETGIVNEPLMKIGDYADSMSRAQTGIDIPTGIGQNTLDVLTTVKPSSMSIEYTSADENRSRSKRISLLKSPLKKRLIK